MANDQNKGASTRRTSRLRYPYYHLRTALEICQRIFAERGGGVSQDGLAEMLATSTDKSAFQMKVGAAELFGLLVREGDNLRVTDLALRIVKPRSQADEAQAMADAFLSVPLFDAVQKAYAGRPLPPDEGLKNALEIDFGVLSKRVADAFATLIRSAQQAGLLYRSGGNTYLSRGASVPEPSRRDEPPTRSEQEESGGVKVLFEDHPHPALAGLLQVLPASNAHWSAQERDRWLKAFEATVKLLYPAEDEG
jgi:hypothetical protein